MKCQLFTSRSSHCIYLFTSFCSHQPHTTCEPVLCNTATIYCCELTSANWFRGSQLLDRGTFPTHVCLWHLRWPINPHPNWMSCCSVWGFWKDSLSSCPCLLCYRRVPVSYVIVVSLFLVLSSCPCFLFFFSHFPFISFTVSLGSSSSEVGWGTVQQGGSSQVQFRWGHWFIEVLGSIPGATKF
jgi:hypothetical protein